MNKQLKMAMLSSLLVLSVSTQAKASFFSFFNAPTPPANVQQVTSIISAKAPNLNPRVLRLALTAFVNAKRLGYRGKNILTVIDYSLPDYTNRLWVIDLNRDNVLYNTLVAHGQGSGNVTASRFSNESETHSSSIGLFMTQNTYYGHDGLSLRLNGLDKGFNSNALYRDIVMHGAWYVDPHLAEITGHIGRSWGCPALPESMARPVINTIKGGSFVFAYAPNTSWLHESRFLNA